MHSLYYSNIVSKHSHCQQGALSDHVYCFLGILTELQKATISVVMSVHSSAHLSAWNSLIPTGQTHEV